MKQGYLDEQFCQVEDLQDEASPNFAEEVVTLFFKDSARLISNVEQALEKYPKDFNRWDAYMQQLKGSCSSIGASRMKSECMSFRDYCGQGNVEGCMRSFQKVKREHGALRQKLEAYFQKRIVAVPYTSGSRRSRRDCMWIRTLCSAYVGPPRLVEAIDKAINHVDAPWMIGVVYVYRHTNDGYYTIASVGTMAEIQKIQHLDDSSSCIFSHGQQRFRLMCHWLDVDGVPWGEVQIIEEDTPQRTPRDAFGQLAATNSFRQCASSTVTSLHASCSTQLDHVDSDMDRDSLSPTSTSSDYSVTDKRIYLLGSRSSGLVRCGIVDESSNEGQNSIPEQSCQSHKSVKEIDGYGQPDKNTNTGDDDNLCFISSKSFQRARNKDTKQQKHYFATKNASQAPLSFWPRWAYEMYDSYSLSRRAADLWRQVILNPIMDDHVRKPNYLSFCFGSKLPISESLRQELLEIDGISYRLQREIQLLKAFNIIRCRNCLTRIARRSDMVVTSSDSPMMTHSKPHSSVKEIITVYSATGLALRGDPSKTHSWFPEYTWTIALCSACQSNIGWLFRADNKNLHPRSFWAIRTSQVSDDTQSR
ncbi:unnamed protein product [Miscanthus lutarioriparius]|uniref:Histidine-containing phosphotransfer protein n=1 Tax=Miscanthus lutarioriparius TaxID=422564 RepID=A0A811NWG3_9POAL|nr:unnamed protein product [Miscanthus lutarioriparius]